MSCAHQWHAASRGCHAALCSLGQASQAGHSFLQGLPGIFRSKLGSPRRAVCMLCMVAAILQQLVPAARSSYQRRGTRL